MVIKSNFRPVTIDLVGEDKTSVCAHELASLLEKKSYEVKKVVFTPPKLGGNSFGEFVVTWKNKRYGKIAHVE